MEIFRLVLLVLLPLATFRPLLGSDFIAYDDQDYVTENGSVRGGLTWAGIRWAFTTGHASNWHPLTWISHMADVSLFGLNPAGHHATNLALHVINTLLLYLLLRRLTGDAWPSAWASALFAIHPAHVESVAWVAERKDVLSSAFWLVTMLAYVSWVRRRGTGRYLAVLLFFAAGLLSKPMLVSLPLVLLLLDYWPLARVSGRGAWPGLLLEKVPFLVLAALSSVVTFLVQRAGGAVRSIESFPLPIRAGNAIVSYFRYLRALVWPAKLAVFYPHRGLSLSPGSVAWTAMLFFGICLAGVLFREKAPWFFVGWFWFVVTLIPVIGLVQVGLQSHADRYTYIPFVGLFVAIAWGTRSLVTRRSLPTLAARAAGAATVFALAVAAYAQARLWRDSETLFLHTLRVTKDNATISNNLGDYYNDKGRPAEAVPYLTEAIRLRPKNHEHYTNLGRSLFLLGRLDEADENFRRAIALDPKDATALNNLARTRFVQGEIDDAVRFYEAALAVAPNWGEARERLAIALLMKGLRGAAAEHLRRCVSLDEPTAKDCRQLLESIPALDRGQDDPAAARVRQFLAHAHREAGAALQRRGKIDAALNQLRLAVELLPRSAPFRTDLGSVLVQADRPEEAAAEFQLALEIDPSLAIAHNDLGYLLFLQGRVDAAIRHYSEALRLQPDLALARANLDLALRAREDGKSGHPPAHGSR